MKIEVTPFMRAHRGFKKCPRFVFSKKMSDETLDGLRRLHPSIENVIGCYFNDVEDENSLSFILCEQGICNVFAGSASFSQYSEISLIGFPPEVDEKNTERLRISLTNGESKYFLVKGGEPECGTRDIFTCIVPLQHIVSDAKKARNNL